MFIKVIIDHQGYHLLYLIFTIINYLFILSQVLSFLTILLSNINIYLLILFMIIIQIYNEHLL